MALAPGTRLGSYEVLDLLGAGGMGEVYRARDHELSRTVAIKVVRAGVAGDTDGRARFKREALVLASLNHPHIGQIYGVAEAEGERGLVLELVEGPTLADRIAERGQKGLRIRDALTIAKQIADALDAAHARGIVHRDLKPANIKVTPAGVVKVLDFGLARVVDAGLASGAADIGVAREQTETTRFEEATRAGLIVGTAAYMSPEQARGLGVDKRTDVWAFGCVLFEMLTGRRPFVGATPTDTLAAILEREPDWSLLPSATPAPIRQLLDRCLRKDASHRLRDIGDVRLQIEDALQGPLSGAPELMGRPGSGAEKKPRTPLLVAIAAMAALSIAGVAYWRRAPVSAPPPSPTLRVSIATPGPISPQLGAVLSPNGREIAFVATGPSAKAMLWVRSLDSLQAHELAGTERAAHPFWSPDGRAIGFIADAKIKRVDVPGGGVQTLVDAGPRVGPAWGPAGILFSPRMDRLALVAPTGGAATPIISADPARKQTLALWPRFLPDGRHFVFFGATESPDGRGIYVGSLDSPGIRLLLKTDFRAWYATPGYLLFIREETLMAQPFDTTRLELTGTPAPIAEGVWTARGAAQASFSVSETGAVAYVNASLNDGQLFWFDRTGRPLGPLNPPTRNEGLTPVVSPNGRRVAIGRGEFGRQDIWVLNASSGAASRLTFTPQDDGLPVWSADSRRLMFRAGRQVFVKDVDSGVEDTVTTADGYVSDWSRDGRYILVGRVANSNEDIGVIDLFGDRKPAVFAETPFNETQARISPDGRWVAYTANDSGRDEVYLQSFPTPGRKRQVSADGGAMPRWRADGAELFYVATNQFMTSVKLSGGAALVLGSQVPLFRTRLIVAGSESLGLPTMYDVSPDGERFLIRYSPEEAGPAITVVTNWMGALPK